ncbi:hypothetical protein Tco_1089230 [Tanacetum coccineum]
MGAHINDTANVKVSATSNSTPITSASMPESILFAEKLKGDMTREKFANRANGFFLGKRIAYPLVTNYVGTTRSKYRPVKSMLNSSNGLFFFQSSSKDGLVAMLVNGPLFIRSNPFILIKWNPEVKLQKKDVGTPLMLDSYTSDMCMPSWGRSSYARALIDLRVDGELKNTIVVAMLKVTVEEFNLCTICVEYEWKPHSVRVARFLDTF